jgi:Cu/Zn superoxide dismutase
MRSADSNNTHSATSIVRAWRGSSRGLRIGVAAAASGVIAGGVLALAASAGAVTDGPGGVNTASDRHFGYTFTTLDNGADPTFNQLLGINNNGTIAGYFGSGAAGHPNQGYLLRRPGGYVSENYPGSVQTQVTGLNNAGITVGFFSDQNNASQVNDNFGFVERAGRFTQVNFPAASSNPPVNQLLGVNDRGIAAGFYTDSQGVNHGYTYDIRTGRFAPVQAPGGGGLTAAAINDSGQIAGFYATTSGATDGFVTDGRHFTDLAFPAASQTMALGVNGSGEVVGTYTTGSGDAAQTHGFTWTSRGGFRTVDDPNGVGATTVNGVNDHGDLVGFYTDSAGNTDGFLAVPGMMRGTPTAPAPTPMPSPSPSSQGMGGNQQGMGGNWGQQGMGGNGGQQGMGGNGRQQSMTVSLQPMPAGTVSLSQGDQGLTAQVSVSGLTPGSSHAVELRNGATVVTPFTTLTADGSGQASTTLTSTYTGSIPAGSRMVILNGAADDGGVDSQLIADSFVGGNADNGGSMGNLRALDITGDGTEYKTLTGTATLVYDPAAQTLTVTVNASGLTPGAHAAHIHIGSCASQGSVQYMLMDLMANSQGQVDGETRVISGVASPIPATGMYLNIHQGDSNTILANGQPTIAFRPLLCANI